MRLLFIPNIGITEIRGDSSWHTTIDFCRHGVGRLFAYIVLPDNYVDRVPEDMLPPSVKIVFAPYKTPGFFEWEGYLDRWLHQMFSQTVGRYPVDAAYLTSAYGVAPLQRLLSNRERRRGTGFPVIIGDLMVFDPHGFSYGTYGTEQAYHAMRALGYALGHSFVSSVFDSKRLARLCRRYLSPAMCRQVEAQSHPVGMGIQCAEIERIIAGIEKDPQYTVCWSGRMNPATGSDVALGTMQMLYLAGHETPAIVNTQTAEMTARAYMADNEIDPPPTWDVTYNTGRREFLRRIARAHVFLHMGRAWGLGNRLKEQFYCNLIGILPDRPYMPELVGEGYPFLYRTKEQAYGMVRWLETHWHDPDVQGKLAEIKARIRTRFDNSVVRGLQIDIAVQAAEEARTQIDRSLFGRENANRKLVEDALILLGRPSLVSWRDVLQAMDSLERRYFNEHRSARLTPFDVYRGLKFLGGEDTLETAEPLFRFTQPVGGEE